MGRSFNVAKMPSGDAPQIQSIAYTNGQTFVKGAVVIDNTAGTVDECANGAVSVLGVAMEGAGTKPGYDLPNSSVTTVVTGRVQEVSVAIADRTSIFSARGVNGGTDPVLPLQTHINEQYGIVKTAGGDWVINFADTTNKAVEIVDIVPEGNFFLVKFINGVLSHP